MLSLVDNANVRSEHKKNTPQVLSLKPEYKAVNLSLCHFEQTVIATFTKAWTERISWTILNTIFFFFENVWLFYLCFSNCWGKISKGKCWCFLGFFSGPQTQTKFVQNRSFRKNQGNAEEIKWNIDMDLKSKKWHPFVQNIRITKVNNCFIREKV